MWPIKDVDIGVLTWLSHGHWTCCACSLLASLLEKMADAACYLLWPSQLQHIRLMPVCRVIIVSMASDRCKGVSGQHGVALMCGTTPRSQHSTQSKELNCHHAYSQYTSQYVPKNDNITRLVPALITPQQALRGDPDAGPLKPACLVQAQHSQSAFLILTHCLLTCVTYQHHP